MYLIKHKDGSFRPYDDNDDEESAKVTIGEVVKCKRSRNLQHHKKGFAILKTGFDNQSKYENFEVYRKVMTILAGHYYVVPTDTGPQYIPKSISFENMSQGVFNKWYDDTVRVIARDLGITTDELLNEV